MTAYLAGGKGISFLRLSVITLTFTSSKDITRYLEVKSFANGKITVLADTPLKNNTRVEVIDLENIRNALHISHNLIDNITDIKLGT